MSRIVREPKDLIRLLLRSVYLKGQMDAYKKTADVESWEDDILNQIIKIIKEKIPKKRERTGRQNNSRFNKKVDGFNEAIDTITNALSETE